jgi:hypothetical protein
MFRHVAQGDLEIVPQHKNDFRRVCSP